MNIAEMFARHVAEQNTPITILPEAAVMTLREFAERYRSPPTFKQGDLVTPVKGGSVKGAGDCHIVLETDMDAKPDFHGLQASNSYGSRAQVRMGCMVGDFFATYWVEAYQLEPWPVA